MISFFFIYIRPQQYEKPQSLIREVVRVDTHGNSCPTYDDSEDFFGTSNKRTIIASESAQLKEM